MIECEDTRHRVGVCLFGLVLLSVPFLAGCQPEERKDLGWDNYDPVLIELDRPIPILYEGRSSPLPLHTKQYKALLSWLSSQGIPQEGVWYLHVAANWKSGYGPDWRVAEVLVFLRPSLEAGRIRRGRLYWLDVSGEEVRTDFRFEDYGPLEYAQVPMPGETFGKTLAVPGRLDWPFLMLANFPSEEVVHAADTSREMLSQGKTQSFGYRGLPFWMGRQGLQQEPKVHLHIFLDKDKTFVRPGPILRMEIGPLGQIVVGAGGGYYGEYMGVNEIHVPRTNHPLSASAPAIEYRILSHGIVTTASAPADAQGE